ncbi:sirohydrochlorin chelatase [Mycobacterium heckeshornense]|uniref:Ferrochelatase n=1 Tax=Mycobacterium heckeshornense TaxID=110505 RepID=A0A2G8BGH2_9MYCO|nr:sirohydrochlorin chelatase [Mycobacterium heckeshornense]KMV20093.1 sirohydrochlorin ferrochelatase [Mycobacterium heckeshornense]MCV7032646.1 sirohydrochlorin chelatase [Mycobacterium heckeshornense]PIJ36867.1 sirohydrochlorin chelatase [Mycobacterium heckeshornense]BCO35373.1 ferrochelatase [Mycobacterium heckeshornense]
MTALVLTAHGSKDPRSAANVRAVASRIALLRPDLDVRIAFLEQNSPNLVDVLGGLPDVRKAVVSPLLLASAYHARVDIPKQIVRAGAHGARQAGVLGEDDRLVSVVRERLAEVGVCARDCEVGVLVVAIGSSDRAVNARTATVAAKLAAETRWAGAATAFVTGPQPSVAQAADRLRSRGARRLVVAPWFLGPGRLPDRVQAFAHHEGVAMAAPLGAHRLVAETVLDRFEEALAGPAAAA